MEINVNDGDKIVEIWLTNAEKGDSELRASLKPVYANYADKKYTVAVLESGDRGLHENTYGLVMQNMKLICW